MWAAPPRAGVLSGAAAAAPKSARTGPDDLSPTRSDRFVPPFNSGALPSPSWSSPACSGRVADKGREDGARVASPVGGERHAEQGHSCWRCFKPRQNSTRRAAEPAQRCGSWTWRSAFGSCHSPQVSSPWGEGTAPLGDKSEPASRYFGTTAYNGGSRMSHTLKLLIGSLAVLALPSLSACNTARRHGRRRGGRG